MTRKTKAEKWHGAWIYLYEGDDNELYFYDHGVTLEEMFEDVEFADRVKQTLDVKDIAEFWEKYNYDLSEKYARWTLWAEEPDSGMQAFEACYKPGCGAFKVTKLDCYRKNECSHKRRDGNCSLTEKFIEPLDGIYGGYHVTHKKCDHVPLPEDFRDCYRYRLFWRKYKKRLENVKNQNV